MITKMGNNFNKGRDQLHLTGIANPFGIDPSKKPNGSSGR